VRYEHKYPLGLGRKKAPDDRDKRFAISAVEPKQDRRMWPMRYAWLDQNGWPHCVGYSWTHWAADAPVLQPNIVADANYADQLYFECQKVDEWPGENYDGTSVRAGTKVLQARGLIQSYRWAWDANTVVSTVINEGPVVMGSDWYAGMSKPRYDSVTQRYWLEMTGSYQGGHAYILNGAVILRRSDGSWDLDKSFVRMKNSWGRAWAFNGHARMSFRVLEELIQADGEACLAIEVQG
jgi:hypothetical protein